MGFLAAFISAVFSTSKDLVSKRLAFSIDGTVSAFASFVFALPYYLVGLALMYVWGAEHLEVSGEAFKLVLLRSITDTFAEMSKMYALMFADISLVVSIFALYPILLVIISPFITGDPVKTTTIFAIALIVLGSLTLAYKPASTALRDQRKGIMLALVSSVFFALNSCFDRLAVQKATPLVSGFAMTLLSALFIAPLMVRRLDRIAALKTHRKNFFLRGFFEMGFMVGKLTALQYYSAPVVVGIQKFALLFSIVGGKVVFNEGDFWRRLLAGAFVFSGILVILFS